MSTYSAGLLNADTLNVTGTLETNQALVTNLSSLNITTSNLDISGSVLAQNLEMFDTLDNSVTLNGTQLNALLGLLNVDMGETVVFPSYVNGTASSNFGGVFTYRITDVSVNDYQYFEEMYDGSNNHWTSKNLSSSIGYIEAGNPSGRLCLLLHGWPGLPTLFTQLILSLLSLHPEWHYVAPYYPGVYPSGPDTVNNVVWHYFDSSYNVTSTAPINTTTYPDYSGNQTGYINNPDSSIGAVTEYIFQFVTNIRPDAVDPSGNKNMVIFGDDWGSFIADRLTIVKSSSFSTNTRVMLSDTQLLMSNLLSTGLYQPPWNVPLNWYYNNSYNWYMPVNSGSLQSHGGIAFNAITNKTEYLTSINRAWLDASGNVPNIVNTIKFWNPTLQLHQNFINDLNNSWGTNNSSYSFYTGMNWYKTSCPYINRLITPARIDELVTQGIGTETIFNGSTPGPIPGFSGFVGGMTSLRVQNAVFSYVHGNNDANTLTEAVIPFVAPAGSFLPFIWWPNFHEQYNIPNVGKYTYVYNPELVAGYVNELINHVV